ncbi:hypothetical protein TNCV_4912491 [Trichonephila clavipes]|nr:hypothetical protein TNCV_4912491 [Trichonephila clavipes]
MKNIKEIDFDQVQSSSLDHVVELTGIQQAGSSHNHTRDYSIAILIRISIHESSILHIHTKFHAVLVQFSSVQYCTDGRPELPNFLQKRPRAFVPSFFRTQTSLVRHVSLREQMIELEE